jgi:hypothetical protein
MTATGPFCGVAADYPGVPGKSVAVFRGGLINSHAHAWAR